MSPILVTTLRTVNDLVLLVLLGSVGVLAVLTRGVARDLRRATPGPGGPPTGSDPVPRPREGR